MPVEPTPVDREALIARLIEERDRAREQRDCADEAAEKAERIVAALQEAHRDGLHYELDGPGVQPCVCGNDWICPRWAEPSLDDYEQIIADLRAANARQSETIRGLHKPVEFQLGGEGGTNCALCYGLSYPCPTVAALSSVGIGEGEPT